MCSLPLYIVALTALGAMAVSVTVQGEPGTGRWVASTLLGALDRDLALVTLVLNTGLRGS